MRVLAVVGESKFGITYEIVCCVARLGRVLGSAAVGVWGLGPGPRPRINWSVATVKVQRNLFFPTGQASLPDSLSPTFGLGTMTYILLRPHPSSSGWTSITTLPYVLRELMASRALGNVSRLNDSG